MPKIIVWRSLTAILLLASLAACSNRPAKPQPAELAPNVVLLGVRPTWSGKIGEVNFPLSLSAQGDAVTLASGDGTVLSLDARSGHELWRGSVGAPIAAGVGGSGRLAAVVTRDNQVVVLEAGRELWRRQLTAQVYTAPFVAGGRVFVLAADRSVSAFDGASGRKLWTQQRPGEPLVLRQSGVMLAVDDTLVVGLSGQLVGLSPDNGGIRWEAPLALPRGVNDVERLVDLVSGVSRVGNVICARAFQTSVGCVDARLGKVLWSKPANGFEGVGGDDRLVFGTESDGSVLAWRRGDGERAWVSERLRYRSLSAPVVLGRSVAVGDGDGLVHLLSREDGSPLNRLSTDGSPIAATPVLAGGDTLVVITRSGGVYGFRPD